MQDGISGKGKLAEAFPGWEAAPSQELSSVEERAFAREIIGRYRADCGERGRAVSGGSAREFVEREIVRRRPQAVELAGWKGGLNWFFGRRRERRRQALIGLPPLGRADSGATDRERRLIERIRMELGVADSVAQLDDGPAVGGAKSAGWVKGRERGWDG